jgi:hypothetical protein
VSRYQPKDCANSCPILWEEASRDIHTPLEVASETAAGNQMMRERKAHTRREHTYLIVVQIEQSLKDKNHVGHPQKHFLLISVRIKMAEIIQ